MIPSAASVATASANRTGCRACATQYPGSGSATSSPDSAPAHGTCGAACSSPAAISPSSARTGSIRCEWNACDTRSLRTRRAAARTARHRLYRRLVTGDHHRRRAVHRRDADPGDAASTSLTSASVAAIAHIAPPDGSACISRARAATSAHASSSDSTPAA